MTDSNSYDSFGNPSNSSFPTRYQFTGREYDSFSGLQYNRARFYGPTIGRFISEDPIGFAGGDVNRYGYVGENPTNATDPSGLYEEDFHYYVTYYLVKRNGCFSDTDARIIAFGAQWPDINDATSPALGKTFANAAFHALNPGARPGGVSPYFGHNYAHRSSFEMGINLHYYQDSYSHAGFGDPYYGHRNAGHSVDKTSEDVVKAVQAAKGTSDELSNYSMARCGCQGKPWDYETASVITRFASVSTSWPTTADISGSIYGSFRLFGAFGDPDALNKKTYVLGIQR